MNISVACYESAQNSQKVTEHIIDSYCFIYFFKGQFHYYQFHVVPNPYYLLSCMGQTCPMSFFQNNMKVILVLSYFSIIYVLKGFESQSSHSF